MIKSEVIIKSEKILEYIQMTLLRRRDVSDISTWYSPQYCSLLTLV